MRIRKSLVLVAILATGCSPESDAVESAPDEVTGVIVEIDSLSLEDIRGFTVRAEGETYEILIDSDVEYGFPLSHLNAHLAGADPVLVDLEERDGKLYALSIEDA